MINRLLTFLLCFGAGALNAQSWELVKTFGDQDNEDFTCITRSDNGYYYVAGSFDNTFSMGNKSIANNNGQDAFIAKLTDGFKVIWAISLTNNDTIQVLDIEMDSNGYLYASGEYKSGFDLNHKGGKESFNGPTSNLGFDLFAIKLDTAGEYLDGYLSKEPIDSRLNDMAISLDADVVLAGSTLNSTTGKDGYLVGVPFNKNTEWKQRIEGLGVDEFTGVDFHNSGNMIVVGFFEKSATLNNKLKSVNGKGITMATAFYGADGSFRDVLTLDSANIKPLKVFEFNNKVYTAGTFNGKFNGLESKNGDDGFLMMQEYHDSLITLRTLNTSQLNTNGFINIEAIMPVLSNREILLVGYFSGSISADAFSESISNGFGIYTARFKTNSWSDYGDCSGINIANVGGESAKKLDACVYTTGVLLAGEVSNKSTFGDTTVVATKSDGFIAWNDILTLSTTSNSNTVCLESSGKDSFPVTVNYSGNFKKRNQFYFELSRDSSFNNYVSIPIKLRENSRIQYFTVNDTFSTGNYVFRLASSNPRIISDQVRTLSVDELPKLRPIILGADTVNRGTHQVFSATNIDPNAGSTRWFPKPDSLLNDTTAVYNTILSGRVGLTIVSEFGACSLYGSKTLTVAPEIKIEGRDERSNYTKRRCETDTMTFYLFTEGYFTWKNHFKILVDTSRDFLNPSVVDSFKSDQNIYGDDKLITIGWQNLNAGEYYLKVASSDPKNEEYARNVYTIMIDTIPQKANISGSKLVALNQTYTYNSGSANAWWHVENGQLISGNGTGQVEVEWQGPEAGLLVAQPFNGNCKGMADSLEIDVVNSIKNINSIINMYPNPAKSNLNISVKQPATISVIGIDGRTIMNQHTLKAGENTLDVSKLKTGSYIIKIIDGTTVQSLLWQIER